MSTAASMLSGADHTGESESRHLPRTVLVADDEHLVALGIAENLQHLGIEVVGPACNGAEAIELARAHPDVDLALLDIRMPRMDGLDAAAALYREMGIPVVIVSAFSDPTYIRRGSHIGIYGYVLKPVTSDELHACLAVAWSRYLQHNQICGQVDELKQALEDRKRIERAKGILMNRLQMTEADAMRRLQKQARDTRKRLPDVAQSIIENEDLFRGT